MFSNIVIAGSCLRNFSEFVILVVFRYEKMCVQAVWLQRFRITITGKKLK